ncbi:lipopolysaccharide core biosynthesis mannosyltransferase LpcC [Bartonella clarridgeiae 73]|uniref:Lipopolysaccharide core biosynthesis mannosyltransferase LpcC n=1 Tax=Bartonella clarridgeiae (strain CCUG 45776 / CIP 104772 / 73) TaxID=696125 RepID=E6YGN2_BARC7|nr:glycosyltransferase family 4 protein [Bartonella clarridgeiae]WCR55385.1 MAG: Lipopolysaccharide core biosynthesis mannosyltransferase WadC [Bartonella clarridgeiae]CBI76020.1 lipopolysaccharide core biosynthesis mannosyltransferase LpcC [Bartonella clarridgeiae 73]
MRVSLKKTDIIVPHFKKRLSGVTTTVIHLVPLQRKQGIYISTLGVGLPKNLPALSFKDLFGLWKSPIGKSFRIWHARRNIEMLCGVFLRDVLKMKLKLIFTSASQRHHKPFTKWLIRRMDKVIATSKRTGGYLEVPHQVIMHGVDLERFSPPKTVNDCFSASGLPGKYAVGCFGRLRYLKGTDLFVDAMLELLPNYPDWTAIIAGRTTVKYYHFEKQLRQKIATAGLSDRIIFLGEIQDIPLWYRRLSLYVAPSRIEGFGLTPLEAMASQTAVVASNAGMYEELVTEGTGKVVSAGDRVALIEAIELYFSDLKKTIIAGKKALTHVRTHFPLEKEAVAIGHVYKEMFAGETF